MLHPRREDAPSMPQILIRAHKNPFTVADADTTYRRNLIGNNTGNLVFSQAVYRLLSTADAQLETSGLAGSQPRVINSRFDHVVIPAGQRVPGQLHREAGCAEHPDRATDHPGERTGRRVTGFPGWHLRGADRVKPAATRFVRAVLNRSPSIGVRGEQTRDYLKSLGFGDEHVKVIGCPSMFMYGPDLHVEKKVESLTR